MPANVGFDNPSGDKSKDDLDRWRFALDIAEVISSTPPDWSVRIGLFGSWGSGKSTVLRYIADDLEKQGSVIVDFNPAFDSNFSDVISAFGVRLIQMLDKRGLYVEPKVKKMARKFSWVRSRTAVSAVDATAEWFRAAKLAGVGLGAVSLWLTPSGEQIKKICEKLTDQRIVVLIDDLDRTSAALLPQFLLSLRELLDLPRFAFVLAFDDAIVAQALHQQNPEWEHGVDFLEKVLDFRFSLPPTTTFGQQQLLGRALRENAPFVPVDSVNEVQDLLPENPRKLKALVRGFRSVKTTIERHNPGEFSWTDLWLVQLLQQESHVVLQRLGDQQTFNQTVGISYRLLTDSPSGAVNRSDIADVRTAKLLEGAALSPQSELQVSALLKAMRARSSFALQYVLGWLLRPPALTWKEFDGLLELCTHDELPSALDAALNHHAVTREDSAERVRQEFFDALSSRASEVLDKAMRSTTASNRDALLVKAGLLRNVTRQFFAISGTLSADRFMTLYKNAQYWLGIRRNDAERSLREVEKNDLVSLASGLTDSDAATVFEKLQPWSSAPIVIPGEAAGLRIGLRDEVANVVRPRIETQLLTFLKEEGSVRRLSEPGKFQMFKAMLFNELPIRDSPVRCGFCLFLRSAAQNEATLRNVEFFKELLVAALAYKGGDIGRSDAEILIKDDEVLSLLWDALRSRELLPDGVVRLLAVRARFIEMGAPPDAMVLDEQLESQLQSFENHREEILGSMR